MSISERLSGPVMRFGEWKFVNYPRRECDFSNEAQIKIFREMAKGFRERRKMKLSDLVRQGLLGGLPITNPQELQNILTEGGLVVAMNHYSGGVVEGNAQVAAVSYVIEEARVERQIGDTIHDTTAYIRFIQAGQTGIKLFHFVGEATNKIVGDSLGNFLVNRDGRRNSEFSRSLLRVIKNLKKGGVVGICPEGTMNFQFGEIDEKAVEFFDLVSRLDYPVLPVAAWSENGKYFVRIGKPISAKEDLSTEVMAAIDLLLPPNQRHVWGYNPPISP